MIQTQIRANSDRNKKFLICNFMEELLEIYNTSIRTGLPTVFKIKDFKSIKFPVFTEDESFILETLKDYELITGLIKIEGDTVLPTSKALLLAKKPQHDWDLNVN